MSKFIKAEEVFKDLSDSTKDMIFKLAAGKVVYFPKNQDKMPLDHDQICIKYANPNRSYEDIGEEYGLSKMRICQIIKEERRRYSEERVKYWKGQGMSLRGIAKLFKRSHEAVR
ncbi:MAG TPA: sigma factor-like helix-turn-helix DNA-binding protein [bacterium]